MADKRKTSLITGAGQNIGRACALALADAGFNVVINGRRKQEPCEAVAKEVQAKGVDALVVMGDVDIRKNDNGQHQTQPQPNMMR